MDIARYAIDRPVTTWILILSCLLGGLWGYLSIGRLEDPAFTLQEAVVVTTWPGASAEEVELEVTETLESAIQQMPQLRRVTSMSEPGLSIINVVIRSTYGSEQLPQVWDELRRKVGDAAGGLPEGAGPPQVRDDFGDVFGLFYAVTAPGFTDRQLRTLATDLRRDLLAVPGVSKIETEGLPSEVIEIIVPRERMAALGIGPDQILNAIRVQNQVTETGAVRLDDLSLRIAVPRTVGSTEALAGLRVGRPGTTDQIALTDIATIAREAEEVPRLKIRHNAQDAFTLAIAGIATENIVDVGAQVEARMAELRADLPLGVTIAPIYAQNQVVDQAVGDFVINLVASVGIVVLVLCVFMGWRVGLIVGATLFLNVAGTVAIMAVAGIEMERISLGALIIAMGMLVDNAIVVAEGALIGVQQGRRPRDAAAEACRRTQVPLLGATVIGIMAFSGIGLSPDSTGEFLFSLFAVVAISLLLSWVLAVTVTPLFCVYLLAGVKRIAEGADPYGGLLYGTYKRVLRGTLRFRWLAVMALVVATGLSFWGFGQVRQQFFPPSNTPMFFVHYSLPQGTDIRATNRDIEAIEADLLSRPGVTAVTAFVGQGASRFMLTYGPPDASAAYGQLIVRTETLEQIEPLIASLRAEIPARFPAAFFRTERLVFGPGGGAKIRARLSGEDPTVLRSLAAEVEQIFAGSGALVDIRTDWRTQELTLVPRLDEDRARISGLSRGDVAQTLAFATTGITATTVRDGDQTIPVLLRPPLEERATAGRLTDQLIWSEAAQAFIPLDQVVARTDLVAAEVLIRRRDRVRTLTVDADPAGNLTATEALAAVRAQVEALDLPPGYRLAWGGEVEDTAEAQGALGASLPPGFLIMLVISVLLFGKLRQPAIVWLVVPMSVCGVVAGLLATGLPFSFTALLGLLSLSGMLMKNAIVLIEEIDLRIDEAGTDGDRLTAIVEASVSRLRPVFLAAATTILGMIPLLSDAFFASMSVTIMGGLAFATVLTLVAVPVLYALFFRIRAFGR
ncbi:efflux RND transporter permease subunit [Paracoccus sanguinis]|uniref:Multidrug transporter AcrB n=1 Tax=Paracoccus sanguinis TaxID=1545044 RepID=A0A099GNF3_9RHOB|nr:efflux RND transporter permease subunit [Paracoccus sanguinis]KGJ23583.1 multidrug transporter AcrB [Paracoccus sanguinis]